MHLADVIEGLTGLRPAWSGLGQVAVSSIEVDSRRITSGGVFFAEHTGQRDGHQFLSDALARGAAAVVIEPYALPQVSGLARLQANGEGYALSLPLSAAPTPLAVVVDDTLVALQRLAKFWRDRLPVRVIGITGSVGKTTSKEIISRILAQRYTTLKSEGSYNNEIGLPLTLLKLTGRHQRAVLEMGMYAKGEIRDLCRLASPHVGVITNVGPSHLERLGSIEAIAEAKAELVEALPPDGLAILNGDDPRVRAMRDKTAARVFLYGLTPDCDLWASDVDSRGLEGIAFRIHYGRENLVLTVPLLGLHSVHTALRGIAVGLTDGLSWEEILAGMQSREAQIRLVTIPGVNGATLLDDTYNASPDSSLAALNLLREMPGRRIAVMGDMLELGSYETEGHALVGCRAAEITDRLVAVGERARKIAEAARACGMKADCVQWVPTNEAALDVLKTMLQPGDFVLIKGSRGVHMETIVAGLAEPSLDKRRGADRQAGGQN